MSIRPNLGQPKISVVVNSRSKAAVRRSLELSNQLDGHFDLEILATNHHGHATALAETAARELASIIVVVGGDGTINQCVNGLIASGRTADELPAIVIWPSGSGNDFSRTFPCPKSLDQLVATIQQAETTAIDIGQVDYATADRRYFVNIAEIGIGTTVIQRAERTQNWLGDRLSYQLAILATVASCPEFEGKVSGDDFSFRGRFSTIAVANAKYFGSGLGIAPHADISDGLLDVVLLRAFGPLDFIRFIGKLRNCEPVQDPRVQVYQTRQLTVEGKAATSMDGELMHPLPIDIQVVPKRLNMLVCGK